MVVDKHKIWLILTVVIALVALAVLLLYSPSRQSVFGKAIGGGCVQDNDCDNPDLICNANGVCVGAFDCFDDTDCLEGGICLNEYCQCLSPLTRCDFACTDLQNDPNNCGLCGNACTSGQCQNGVCVIDCVPSTEVCDGVDNNCNSQVDEGRICNTPFNCGIFGNACSAGQTCTNGACVVDCGSYARLDGDGFCSPFSCSGAVYGNLNICPGDAVNLTSDQTYIIVSSCTDTKKCEQTCAQGYNYVSGECVATCTPQCSNKQCGPDGCGNFCGFCNSDQECTSGKCVDLPSSPSQCIDPDNTYTPNANNNPSSASVNYSSLSVNTLVVGLPYMDIVDPMDKCSGTNKVQEAYCYNSTHYFFTVFSCPIGTTCQDGACVTSTPEIPTGITTEDQEKLFAAITQKLSSLPENPTTLQKLTAIATGIKEYLNGDKQDLSERQKLQGIIQ